MGSLNQLMMTKNVATNILKNKGSALELLYTIFKEGESPKLKKSIGKMLERKRAREESDQLQDCILKDKIKKISQENMHLFTKMLHLLPKDPKAQKKQLNSCVKYLLKKNTKNSDKLAIT